MTGCHGASTYVCKIQLLWIDFATAATGSAAFEWDMLVLLKSLPGWATPSDETAAQAVKQAVHKYGTAPTEASVQAIQALLDATKRNTALHNYGTSATEASIQAIQALLDPSNLNAADLDVKDLGDADSSVDA